MKVFGIQISKTGAFHLDENDAPFLFSAERDARLYCQGASHPEICSLDLEPLDFSARIVYAIVFDSEEEYFLNSFEAPYLFATQRKARRKAAECGGRVVRRYLTVLRYLGVPASA